MRYITVYRTCFISNFPHKLTLHRSYHSFLSLDSNIFILQANALNHFSKDGKIKLHFSLRVETHTTFALNITHILLNFLQLYKHFPLYRPAFISREEWIWFTTTITALGRIFLRTLSFSVANQYPSVTTGPSEEKHTLHSDSKCHKSPAVPYKDWGELSESNDHLVLMT